MELTAPVRADQLEPGQSGYVANSAANIGSAALSGHPVIISEAVQVYPEADPKAGRSSRLERREGSLPTFNLKLPTAWHGRFDFRAVFRDYLTS